MPYLDTAAYQQYIGGSQPADFDQLVQIADDIIDDLTMYRLRGADLKGLAPFVLEQIKKAAAYLVRQLEQVGGLDAYLKERDRKMTAEKVGNYSRNFGGGATAQNSLYSLAVSYLAPTGLLYRGIG